MRKTFQQIISRAENCQSVPQAHLPIALISQICQDNFQVANELGFDELKVDNLLDLLCIESNPLSTGELLQISEHQEYQCEPGEQETPKKLTSKVFSEALH